MNAHGLSSFPVGGAPLPRPATPGSVPASATTPASPEADPGAARPVDARTPAGDVRHGQRARAADGLDAEPSPPRAGPGTDEFSDLLEPVPSVPAADTTPATSPADTRPDAGAPERLLALLALGWQPATAAPPHAGGPAAVAPAAASAASAASASAASAASAAAAAAARAASAPALPGHAPPAPAPAVPAMNPAAETAGTPPAPASASVAAAAVAAAPLPSAPAATHAVPSDGAPGATPPAPDAPASGPAPRGATTTGEAAAAAAAPAGRPPGDAATATQPPAPAVAATLPVAAVQVTDLGAAATAPGDAAPAVHATGATGANVPVLRAEAAPLLPPLAVPADPGAGFDDGLGTRIAWMADQRMGHAEIRLNPEHAGPIDVRVDLDGDRVDARFHSASAEVRQALEASLPRLRELLGQHGLELGQADVGQQPRDQTPATAASARREGARADATTDGADAPRPPRVSARSLVDTWA